MAISRFGDLRIWVWDLRVSGFADLPQSGLGGKINNHAIRKFRSPNHQITNPPDHELIGSVTSNVVSTPGVLRTATEPPCRSMIALTIDNPKPEPDCDRERSAL